MKRWRCCLQLLLSQPSGRPERKLAQMPAELELPKNGSLFIGEKGNMVLPHVGGPRLYPVETFKDFAYISQLASGQFIIASHPSVPVKSAKELLALAKARPGQLSYGTSGAGGINHLAGELLQSMSGISWVHIPFKGAGPAMIAAMGGEVEFAIASTIGMVNHIKAGKLRGVAVTGNQRYAELPSVPTVAEAGVPGYSVTGWYGFYAPANTPQDIVRRLHEESRRALNSPDIRDKLVKAGNEPVGSTPAEFLAFVRAEAEKWAKVIKQAKLRID